MTDLAPLGVLIGAGIEAGRVILTTRQPDGSRHLLTLPRTLYLTRSPVSPSAERLAVRLAPFPAPPLAVLIVEPDTAQGQAALIALGYAGPYPVPQGVHLGGQQHGAELGEAQALALAALPEYVAGDWALFPSASGGPPFTLLWANAATYEQLKQSSTWAAVTAASFQAADVPSGSA